MLNPAGDRRLRVLHLGKYYTPHKGGIETCVRTLCAELRKAVDARVVVANDARTSSEAVIDGVPISRAGTLFHIGSAPVCAGLVRRIRESDPDLVHIHLPNPGAVLAYLASRNKAPLIVTYHCDVVRQRVASRAFAPFLGRLLRRASAIIASSQNYLDTSRTLAAHLERCRVIPHGISVAALESVNPGAVERLRERYGPRIVLSVGRLVYYKGFEHLIRAMQSVDARLILIGEGPLRARLQRMARHLGLADRVILAGEVDDLVPYYHAADVFILPSVARTEAFGMVQLEAMACGKPVINTSVDSGVPYVSLHGVTGLTVPPEDPRALSTATNLLLDDQELRRRFGAAARRRVLSEFSRDGMVQAVLALYREVLTGTAQAPRHSPQTVSGTGE
jgi:glycosyltransferase involved in cell wall biosynthesis